MDENHETTHGLPQQGESLGSVLLWAATGLFKFFGILFLYGLAFYGLILFMLAWGSGELRWLDRIAEFLLIPFIPFFALSGVTGKGLGLGVSILGMAILFYSFIRR